MKDKKAYIDKILEDVFSLPAPKIKESRKEHISEFISIAVNGDTITAYLVIDVKLDNKDGIYVYILTDTRLFQIEITSDNERSLPFVLSDMIGIELKLTEPERQLVRINFKTEVVGLEYSIKKNEITEFFEKIEKAWAKMRVK